MTSNARKRTARNRQAHADEHGHLFLAPLAPTHPNLRITRTLDLGAAPADRTWHVANPGSTGLGDEATDYRDAMGPIKDNVGRTSTTVDQFRGAIDWRLHARRS